MWSEAVDLFGSKAQYARTGKRFERRDQSAAAAIARA